MKELLFSQPDRGWLIFPRGIISYRDNHQQISLYHQNVPPHKHSITLWSQQTDTGHLNEKGAAWASAHFMR